MLAAATLLGFFTVAWLGGTFWLLHRAGRLRQSSSRKAHQRTRGVSGAVEIYIPTWIGEMKRGHWNGTALPFLVTATAAAGAAYSLIALVLIGAIEERNFPVVTLLLLVTLYATFMIARVLIRSARIAQKDLRNKSGEPRAV